MFSPPPFSRTSLLYLMLASCASVPAMVTEESQLVSRDGDRVTIRGALLVGPGTSTVLGVSVASAPRGMAGLLVVVTGVLRRRSVPVPANPWDSSKQRVGDFFVLVDPADSARLAQAVEWRPN